MPSWPEQYDEWTEMRRYIGPDDLRQSSLTVINGDADPTTEEVLAAPAMTAEHPPTTNHAVANSDTTDPGATIR